MNHQQAFRTYIKFTQAVSKYNKLEKQGLYKAADQKIDEANFYHAQLSAYAVKLRNEYPVVADQLEYTLENYDGYMDTRGLLSDISGEH
jgi:hypothetical protein